MDATVGAVIIAVVGGPLVYLLGNRRLRYERLYERRAEVIAKLTEHLYLMQRGLVSWTYFFQPEDVDRDEQRKAANDAFFELVIYYNSNAVWLDPQTCENIDSVIETAWTTASDYMDNLNERGHPRNKEGLDASVRLYRELPVLRRNLEMEFRAILYPPPWYDAPLRLFERVTHRNRESTGDVANEASEGDAD
jgi:hypothetical protein